METLSTLRQRMLRRWLLAYLCLASLPVLPLLRSGVQLLFYWPELEVQNGKQNQASFEGLRATKWVWRLCQVEEQKCQGKTLVEKQTEG